MLPKMTVTSQLTPVGVEMLPESTRVPGSSSSVICTRNDPFEAEEVDTVTWFWLD